MRRNAFTLIEVLVSLTIIAILASLVVSSARSAIDRSRTTTCISNLRTLHAAMTMYESDYGAYPPNTLLWPGLQPYLGHAKLSCPVELLAMPWRSKHSSPYALLGNFSYDGPIERAINERCSLQRGPEMPLAWDPNHNYPRVAASTRDPFVLVLRAGGSVNRVPGSLFLRVLNRIPPLPCDSARLELNL